jgi:Calcineurin-like phosphoesterase
VALSPAGRTLIVGDVHGCASELRALLDKVAFGASDRLLLVGDLIARGPDSLGVLDLVLETKGRFVRGNHEERLLLARKDSKLKLPESHRVLLTALREDHWQMLAESPLWLDVPEHGARLVHAGLDPALPQIGAQERKVLLNVRTLPDESGEEVLWATRYHGPEQVVFGHHAMQGLQLHPWATGLDTGCVYGNSLTALLLGAGEPIAALAEARRAQLASVPAERIWFDPRGQSR